MRIFIKTVERLWHLSPTITFIIFANRSFFFFFCSLLSIQPRKTFFHSIANKMRRANRNCLPKSLYVVAISPVPHHFVPGMIPLNTENGLIGNWNDLLESSFDGFVLCRSLRLRFCFSTISHWFISLSISLNWISSGRLIFDNCFSNLLPAFCVLQTKKKQIKLGKWATNCGLNVW